MSRSTWSWCAAVASGAVLVSLGRWTHWLSQFSGRFPENAIYGWHDLWSPDWIVVGALLGSFVWMLAHRRGFTRAVWILMIMNWIAWAMFLIFMSRPTEADYREILSRRAIGVHDVVIDAPTILAGRWYGGFTPLSWDGLLRLTGDPAVFVTELEVVPSRFVGTLPTRGESYLIAAIAFVLSTAFWANVGAAMSWARNRLRRRGKEGTV